MKPKASLADCFKTTKRSIPVSERGDFHSIMDPIFAGLQAAEKSVRPENSSGPILSNEISQVQKMLDTVIKNREALAAAIAETVTPSGGATAEGGDTIVLRKPEEGNAPSVLDNLPEDSTPPGDVNSQDSGESDRVWAAKNAATDAQRVRMGLQPRMQPMARAWGMVWDQAMEAISDAEANGRDLAQEILTDYQNNPRIMEDWEVAVMTHELVKRETDLERKKQNMASAATDLQRNEIASQILQQQSANDELFAAIQDTGTRTARALAIRKMMVDDRWDIVKMRSDLRTAQGGKPLTAEQSAQLDKDVAAMKDIAAREQAKDEERLNAKAEELMSSFFENIKKAVAEGKKTKSKLRNALKEQAAAAELRMQERRGQLGSGSGLFNPKYYKDIIIILANDIVQLADKLVDLAKHIKEKFGEEVTEEEVARMKADADALIDSVGLTPNEQKKKVAKAKGKQAAQQDIEAIEGDGVPSKKLVYDAVSVKVAEGMDDPQAIMAAVHADLVKSWPELTERQVKEIFTDYGKTSFPDKNELKAAVRELNVLVTQILHIERMQAGEPPLKKGYQRDKPTQQVREMYKRVAELKKKLGMNKRTDAQLASALDAAKTRLRNQIEDLNAQIAAGGRTADQKAPKTGLEYDTEATALVKQRDDLKAALDEIEGPDVKTFDQMADAILKGLAKSEEILTRKIEKGDFATKQKQGPPVLTPEIEEKLGYLEVLRETIREGRKELEPKKSKEDIALERAQKSLAYWLGILDGSKTPKNQTRTEALTQAEEDVKLQIQAIQQVLREEKADSTRIPEAQKRIQASEKELARLERVMAGTESPKIQKPKTALTQKEEDLNLEIAAMKRQLAQEKAELTRLTDEQKRINALEKRVKNLSGVLNGTIKPKANKDKAGPANEREGYLMAEIQDLQEAIKADRKASRGSSEATGEEKAAAAAYLRAASEYQRRVREGDVMPKGKSVKQTAMGRDRSAAYDAMQKAKQAYKDLRLSRQGEINLAADKANAKRRIEQLEKKIADKDYTTKSKVERQQDKELLNIRLEEWRLKQQWLEGVFNAKRAEWNRVQRWGNSTANFFGWARAWMTGLDLSALGRQAGFMLLSRPIRTLKAVPVMMKASVSDAFAIQHERDLQDPAKRANAALYRRDKLQLTSPYAMSLDKVEENFRTSWLSDPPLWLRFLMKIPVAGQVLKLGQELVKGSARAYTTVLNEIRADSYDALASSLSPTGTPTAEQGKAIADIVNIWTGRGKIPGFKKSEEVLTAMNTLFFAPRYVASRFQSVFMPFWITLREINTRGGNFMQLKSDAELAPVRRLMAAEYLRFAGGIGSLYALYTLFNGTGDDDDKIEWDPRSSSFGKFKFGRTFVDPLAGFAQVITMVSRMSPDFIGGGKKKTPSGEVTEANRWDVMTYFAETKLSPIAGAVRNLAEGKDIRGEETSLLGEFGRIMIPMSIRDIIETGQTQEWGAGTVPIVAAAILGWSVQNYTEDQKENVSNDDYNFLYANAIAIPKVTLSQTLSHIAGFRPKDKESPWAKKITTEQRKLLLTATLPEVSAIVKDIREEFKKAPKDPEERLEFIKTQQKYMNTRVKNARDAAVRDLVK